MTLRRRLERLRGTSAVAIGNFDGFHAGHRRIIKTLSATARSRAVPAVALTFHPHPRVFFRHPIRLISTDRQRLEALRQQALDRLFFIDFATVVSRTAQDFVREVLLGSLRAGFLVVGEDFRCGRDREGDLDFLERQEAAGHFTLVRVANVVVDGRRVSSSEIRRLLGDGNVRQANRMLQHPYFIDGVVEKGLGRGRVLGFPTMNIASENQILPPGVFHTRITVAAREYDSLTNIGRAPTFGGEVPGVKIETHIPGFRGTIYGQRIRLHFIDKIRQEIAFASPGELAEQIRRDITSLGI
ncbi:MAG: riboflavin biosynthesis protein RibF [Candidatus Aminicenantes bacterium]|nr:riboflavin biosynthesis protein RibF [Candidatus Aminicenantes bacterium]